MRSEGKSAKLLNVLWLLVAAGAVVLLLQAGDLYALELLGSGAGEGTDGGGLTLRPVAATSDATLAGSTTSTFLPVSPQPSRAAAGEEVSSSDASSSTGGVPNFALVGDGGDLGRRARDVARRFMPIVFGTMVNDTLYVNLESVLAELETGEIRWGPQRSHALIISDERVVRVVPDTRHAEANLRPVELPGVPAVINGALLMPVRALGPILDAAADYDEQRKLFTVKAGSKRATILAHEDIFQLEVSRGQRRLQVYAFGEPVKSYGLCVGRGNNTPVGHFHIERRAVWPPWTSYEGQYMPGGSRSNPLGARWLGTTARGRERGWAIGIHGTNQPSSIGRRISGGCLRTFNENAIELYNNIPIGTSVWIHEEPITRPDGETP